MITGQSSALSVYDGLFQDWHYRHLKYIMGKYHWVNKTIKPKYLLEPMYVIIYYQNQLQSLFWFNDFALKSKSLSPPRDMQKKKNIGNFN